jgi:hypothetical protein
MRRSRSRPRAGASMDRRSRSTCPSRSGPTRASSLVIQPKDQALFDRAVDSFLRPEIVYGETG